MREMRMSARAARLACEAAGERMIGPRKTFTIVGFRSLPFPLRIRT